MQVEWKLISLLFCDCCLASLYCAGCVVHLIQLRANKCFRSPAYWLNNPSGRSACKKHRGVQYTPVSRLVNRGVFALLQHWLGACQCPVTWCHTDGHVSETQTTRRAATGSQQTHTDTQKRPLVERGKK